MPATVIDGAAIARQIKADVQRRVDALRVQNQSVRLAALLVGATTSVEIYAHRQAES
jgi:5,10-methylene-tetrahydrofolate dehydrogenase/methenyl tetrahydrofolate cyclohydrolase